MILGRRESIPESESESESSPWVRVGVGVGVTQKFIDSAALIRDMLNSSVMKQQNRRGGETRRTNKIIKTRTCVDNEEGPHLAKEVMTASSHNKRQNERAFIINFMHLNIILKCGHHNMAMH